MSNTASALTTRGFRHLSFMQQLAMALAGTVILTLSAYVTIPMIPVPITGQTLAILLVGAFYGPRLGTITVTAWLIEGMAGLPVLAGGTGGLVHFFGPTAGYLFSYPLLTLTTGFMVIRGWNGQHPVKAFFGFLLASTICLFMGWAWLANMIGPQAALASGVTPFLIGDVLKCALAAATLAGYRSIRNHIAQK